MYLIKRISPRSRQSLINCNKYCNNNNIKDSIKTNMYTPDTGNKSKYEFKIPYILQFKYSKQNYNDEIFKSFNKFLSYIFGIIIIYWCCQIYYIIREIRVKYKQISKNHQNNS